MKTAAKYLADHTAWESCCQGPAPKGRKYDLRDADLTRADLTFADLIRADLREACLREACLRGVDLSDADLRRANLTGADLTGADLSGADLSGVSGGPACASVQWAGMGEAGRRMSAYRHTTEGGALEDLYTCGCIEGVTYDAMRQWIMDHDEALQPSRLRALEIVSELMGLQ